MSVKAVKKIVQLVILQSALSLSITINAESENILALVQEAEILIDNQFSGKLANRMAKKKLRQIVESQESEDVKCQELEDYIDSLSVKNTEENGEDQPGQDKQPEEKKEKASIIKSMVTIKCRNGRRASGFIVMLNGKKALITNIHVLY
jgi:ABC-type oligopeptide transport system ATPase subunit